MRLSPEDRAYLDERYGANNRKRWPAYIVSVLVVAFIAWVAWAYWAQIHPKVTSEQTSQTLNNKGTLTSLVTFEVNRANTGVQPRCSVAIVGSQRQQIGFLSGNPFTMTAPKQVTPPRPTATKVTVTWAVVTTQKAYAVQWNGCTAPGQDAPK